MARRPNLLNGLPQTGVDLPARHVALRLARLGLILLALNAAGGWVAAQAWPDLAPQPGEGLSGLWIALAVLCTLVMALPFVPGIEIGLALMLLLGNEGVLLVYLCTQVAMALSYAFGRCVPASLWARCIASPRLVDACPLIVSLDARTAAAPWEMRWHGLVPLCVREWAVRALRHRYLTLAIVLNLPGNAAIGGAGGIGMFAGASRQFSFCGYVLSMAVATSPLPLLLLWRGMA